MINFNSLSKYIFAASLTALSVSAFAQDILPRSHSKVTPRVVNFSQIARQRAEHTARTPRGGNMNCMESAECARGLTNVSRSVSVSRGGTDSIQGSPVPDTTFVAQQYDNYVLASPSGAANDSFLVSTTAYDIAVQYRSGGYTNFATLGDFWSSEVSIDYEWEARVAYDPSVKRWIIAGFSDEYTDTAGVLVGVSFTDNPNDDWYIYKVPADSSGQTFPNFPHLGFNENWIAVSGSRYSMSDVEADTSNIYLFNKSEMMNGQNLGCDVFYVEGVQSALSATSDSSTGDMYILNQWNNTNGELLLRKVTGTPGNEVIKLTGYPASGIPYASAEPNDENFAPQQGSPVNLQTQDDKLTNLVYENGHLWTAQTIYLPYNTPTRCSVQWWEIDTLANIIQLGLIDDSIDNMFYSFPSVAVNKYEDALIGYSVFSPEIYASGGYSFHNHNQPAGVTDSSYIFAPGLNSYVDTSASGYNYWGLWSATVVDPVNNSGFWTIQSYAAATVNTWETQWANIDKNISTGVKNTPEPAPSVQLFPNPNNGTFNLTIEGVQYSTAQVKMFDLLGEEVFSTIVNTSGSSNSVPVVTQGLAKGLYIAEVDVNGQASMQKLVVQ